MGVGALAYKLVVVGNERNELKLKLNSRNHCGMKEKDLQDTLKTENEEWNRKHTTWLAKQGEWFAKQGEWDKFKEDMNIQIDSMTNEVSAYKRVLQQILVRTVVHDDHT